MKQVPGVSYPLEVQVIKHSTKEMQQVANVGVYPKVSDSRSRI